VARPPGHAPDRGPHRAPRGPCDVRVGA
jgi:hypothetical protein